MRRRRVHSHYDTLRVDRGASAQRVRTAYRRLAQKFHPDKHPGRAAAAVVMAQINLAYGVLSDPAQRSAYDEWLASEDARITRQAAARFTPDRFGWGGWLAFAITCIAVLTVGYVLIATWPPTRGTSAGASGGPAASDSAAGAPAGGPPTVRPPAPGH